MPSDIDVEYLLESALAGFGESTEEGETDLSPEDMPEVVDFHAAGVLTHNKGLVLTFGDGSEFQVTIVRSG